jgi:hypothetical protein
MLRTSTAPFRPARSSIPCPSVGFLLLRVTRFVALASIVRHISEARHTDRIFDLLPAHDLAPLPGGCAR